MKINQHNIEQLGIILRAVDLIWVAAQDIDHQGDNKMSDKVSTMTMELVEDIGMSLSECGYVSDMQSVADHIKEEVYKILKEAGYADDDAGCTNAEYEGAKHIAWIHSGLVKEMESWKK
jgi:hypothetical protein